MFKSFSNYVEDRKANPVVHKEYLDDKGKVVEKPKVKVVADYEGPDPKRPPGSDNTTNIPAPYKAANTDSKAEKGESGFGDLGDKKLVYEPDTKGNPKEVGGDWPKTKTEHFLHTTRKMSSAQFTKFMLEGCACNYENLPKITAYEAGSFHPHPAEAIRYVAALTSTNKKFVENLVHELKRENTFGALLATLLEHKEAYQILANLFEENGNGIRRSKNFARALNDYFAETVAPPVGMDGEEDHPDPFHKRDDDEAEDDAMNPDDEEPSDEENPDEDETDDADSEEEPEDEEGISPDDHDPFSEPKPKLLPHKKPASKLGAAMGNFESIKHFMKNYLN